MNTWCRHAGAAQFAAAIGWLAVCGSYLRADDGFTESFADDPIQQQRWRVMDGEDVQRFAYESSSAGLKAHYDTGQPTSRLVRPLPRVITQADSFAALVEFTILGQNFYRHPQFNAQIAWGFLNQTTTGPDRAGFSAAARAFDILTVDYYPNITLWGGPSLGPTIIRTNMGQGFYSAIDFAFGSETELAQAGEPDLPKDVRLLADLRYNPRTRRATVRIFRENTPLPINFGGGIDGDNTTISAQLRRDGFAVDAFGLTLWQDTNPASGGATTVRADVVFSEITVLVPGYGDFDGDADIDADDLELFQACRSGPAIPAEPACAGSDADGDGDVDQTDFGFWQVNLTGAR